MNRYIYIERSTILRVYSEVYCMCQLLLRTGCLLFWSVSAEVLFCKSTSLFIIDLSFTDLLFQHHNHSQMYLLQYHTKTEIRFYIRLVLLDWLDFMAFSLSIFSLIFSLCSEKTCFY